MSVVEIERDGEIETSMGKGATDRIRVALFGSKLVELDAPRTSLKVAVAVPSVMICFGKLEMMRVR